MKKISIALCLLIFLLGCGTNTSYTLTTSDSDKNIYVLNVYLDDKNDMLKVDGELSYKNDDYDLNELYITLYPNAKNPSDRALNVNLIKLSIDNQDRNYEIRGMDKTQVYVELNDTLPKGERISIKFEYEFNYWDSDRLAVYGNNYFTMFFYPFVAIFDDEGWNIDSYTFTGESYYNNIGDYYVSINTPDNYRIATGGKLISEEKDGVRKIFHYELLNARDFSFNASSKYYVYYQNTSNIKYQIYSIRQLTSLEVTTVENTIINAISAFENRIGPYPYDHFTLELGYFYGMESTGIVYCSEEIQEGTIVHEITHQWFYSMIGNDQSDESFLDEAVTSYMTSLYYYDLYGLTGYNTYLDYKSSTSDSLSEYYEANIGKSLLRKVDEFGDQYAYLIYYHGPSMIRYYVDVFLDGDVEQFYNIMQEYFETYKYKIATIDDFLNLIEYKSGISNTKEWFTMQITDFQDFDNRP